MGNQKITNKLDRGTDKPRFLYEQLATILRQEIDAGKWKQGDLLPSMDELSRRFDVNKLTVRQAVKELVAGGWVQSIPAKGTFVTERIPHKNGKPSGPLSIGWISSVYDGGNTGRYHTELFDAVRSAVQEAGGHLLAFSAEQIPHDEFCRTIGRAHLDGAVMIGPVRDEPLKTLLSSGQPAVVIDDIPRGDRADSILPDNEGGGFQGMQHLLELGHRNLAAVTGPLPWRVTRDRLEGVYQAMDQFDVPRSALQIVESNFSPEGGYAALQVIRKSKPRPTGVFCFNDEMAIGFLRAALVDKGLEVPRDMSVVGFDDTQLATLSHPPLTTVRVEKDLMGKEAVARLVKIIRQPNMVSMTTMVPTHLIVRKSTGKLTRK